MKIIPIYVKLLLKMMFPIFFHFYNFRYFKIYAEFLTYGKLALPTVLVV